MASWPAFYYGPKGEAKIFQRAEDVPEGWADTPAAFAQETPAPVDERPPEAPRKPGRRK